MRALLALEVKFASLRDRLYVERLEEAAREEQMILDGELIQFVIDSRHSSRFE